MYLARQDREMRIIDVKAEEKVKTKKRYHFIITDTNIYLDS